MNREAWFCPACKKHHAPHVDTCPGPSSSLPGTAPFLTITAPPKCSLCSMMFDGVMGYVCPRGDCPSQSRGMS